MSTRSRRSSMTAVASASAFASPAPSTRGRSAAAASSLSASAVNAAAGSANDTAAIATEARAVKPRATAAAASSNSGRKRRADTRDSSSSSSAAASASAPAAPSLLSHLQQQMTAAQSKKQRAGASAQGNSVAAAASSVGFEPLAAPSSAAASFSVSTSEGQRNSLVAAQPARSKVDNTKSRAGAPVSAAAAAVSSAQPKLAPIAAAPLRIFVAAQRLIQGALSFAESELRRHIPAAAEVKTKMQELTDAEADLRSIPTLPTTAAGQASPRAAKQARITELTSWLKGHGGYPRYALSTIDQARASTLQPATHTAITNLGLLSSIFVDLQTVITPLPAAQQDVCRTWLLRVDALFTRFSSSKSRFKLTRQQSQEILHVALTAGALQLIPVLMRAQASCVFPIRSIGPDQFLTTECLMPHRHQLSLEPYFRLFEFGLDPTLLGKGGSALSALQLARNFVRDHPLPAVQAPDPMSEMRIALEQDRKQFVGVPSILLAYAMHHHEPAGDMHSQRRKDLHARFMHALVTAWRSHSDKVRALLLKAAPGRLIPPLVDVVSRYLDLEGVPAVVSSAEDESDC